MGEDIAYGSLSFPDTSCPAPVLVVPTTYAMIDTL